MFISVINTFATDKCLWKYFFYFATTHLHSRLRISAWSPLRYQVEGVCGNFDDNQDNDLTGSDGQQYSLQNVDEFVNSWIIEGYGAEGWAKAKFFLLKNIMDLFDELRERGERMFQTGTNDFQNAIKNSQMQVLTYLPKLGNFPISVTHCSWFE